MKFIEVGKKDNQFPVKIYDPHTDTVSFETRPVQEKYVRVYMPWWRVLWCINSDDVQRRQPCWHFYWHPNPTFPHFKHARWGWQ